MGLAGGDQRSICPVCLLRARTVVLSPSILWTCRGGEQSEQGYWTQHVIKASQRLRGHDIIHKVVFQILDRRTPSGPLAFPTRTSRRWDGEDHILGLFYLILIPWRISHEPRVSANMKGAVPFFGGKIRNLFSDNVIFYVDDDPPVTATGTGI